MKKVALFFILALLLTTGYALAGQISPERSTRLIDQDLVSGKISADDAEVYKAYAFFESKSLPARYRTPPEPGDHFSCATAYLISLNKKLPLLSSEAREEIKRILPVPGGRKYSSIPPVSRPKARTDCPEGTVTSNVHYSEHFALRWGSGYNWDTQSSMTFDQIDTIMEFVWDTEVVDMGYPEVYNSDNYYVDLYIGNSGEGVPTIDFAGAYTTLYYSYDDTMPYMVFHPDIFTSDSATKDVLSHEFYHTLQFTIALEGCWGYFDEDTSGWAVEATAVWAEDEVYDDVNSYIYFMAYYWDDPQVTLPSNSNYDPYARVIFFKYISENYGGRDALWTIWNECYSNLWESVENYLDSQGTDWWDAFPEFAVKNLVNDYEEASIYTTHGIEVAITDTVADYPFSQTYENADGSAEVWATNYIRFTPDYGDSLNLRFEGDQYYQSRSITWFVAAIKVRPNGTWEQDTMIPSEVMQESEVSLTGFGDEWSEIYLVVVPMVDYVSPNVSGVTYTVYASEGDDPLPTDDDDDSDDDTAGSSCSDLISAIYISCDYAVADGGDLMSADKAEGLCEDGGSVWECLETCKSSSDSCSALADCAKSECSVTLSQGSGSDDDDDDDDGGSCGC